MNSGFPTRLSIGETIRSKGVSFKLLNADKGRAQVLLSGHDGDRIEIIREDGGLKRAVEKLTTANTVKRMKG